MWYRYAGHVYICMCGDLYPNANCGLIPRYFKFRQYLIIILADIEHAIRCSDRLFVVACTFLPEWLVADRISRWSIFRVRYRLFFLYASDLFDTYIMTRYPPPILPSWTILLCSQFGLSAFLYQVDDAISYPTRSVTLWCY